MLIVAMPKSASTSLLLTLGKAYNIDANQSASFIENPIPPEVNFLDRLHSDVRELSVNDVDEFLRKDKIYKQHIFPSENNVRLLKDKKKVILLRKPEGVCDAYRRGAIKKVHSLLPGFDVSMSDEEWNNKSNEVGLTEDLENFYHDWKSKSDNSNTLFINYKDLVNSPDTVLNKVREFYNLPELENKPELVKARYSRRKGIKQYIFLFVKGVKNTGVKMLEFIGMKSIAKLILKKILGAKNAKRLKNNSF